MTWFKKGNTINAFADRLFKFEASIDAENSSP